MPPRRMSRFTFTLGIQDAAERLFLTDRERFTYRPLADNRQHVVRAGETLYTLAGRYFAPVARAAGLWWVIADFQPVPIVDPTVALEPGSVLVIPSLRTVVESILSESRRSEFQE